MKTFRLWELNQALLFPPSVHDFVPAGHLAHFVRDLVREELDLSAIFAKYSEERGYPPYHPALMVALLLYAYSQAVYSSRKIEKACGERVDFMAVTAMSKPDHTTISEFRRQHLNELIPLFVQVLMLCRDAGLVTLGHVALDGTKVGANASKHKAMSYGRMAEEERKLAAEVREWLERAEREDGDDDDKHGKGRRGDELPEWVKNKEQKLAKIREARKRLEARAREEATEHARVLAERNEGKRRGGSDSRRLKGVPDPKAQINFTDHESRIMKTPDGFDQAYNCQIAVDAANQVIVGNVVSQKPTDVELFVPLLATTSDMVGLPNEISADAGYCSESNLAYATRRHIRAYVATGRQKHGTGSATAHPRDPQRPRTTAMRTRLKRGGFRSRYRLRKQTVEPVFGQIKEARGFRRFLMRGVEKVTGEWSLVCTVHNLLKLAAARTLEAVGLRGLAPAIA